MTRFVRAYPTVTLNLIGRRGTQALALAAAVLIAQVGPGTGSAGAHPPCHPHTIRAAEQRLSTMTAEVATIDESLDGLSLRLRTISDRRANEDASSRSRRVMERLLKESRRVAAQMDRVRARRDSVATSRRALAVELRECYGDSLEILYGRLRETIVAGDLAACATLAQAAGTVERRVGELGDAQPSARYPRLSDSFVERAIDEGEDIESLFDTMSDLLERASRDTLLITQKISDLDRSLALKRDLVALVSEAENSGIDPGGFFEELGRGDVARDIEELENDRRRYEESLEAPRLAISFYQKQIAALRRLSAERREQP